MNESVKLARHIADKFLINSNNKTLGQQASLAIHFPSGSIKKDGPSAGIAITSALLSLGLNKPVVKGFAMTGEITLIGKVLAVGGIKEKVAGAISSEITNII